MCREEEEEWTAAVVLSAAAAAAVVLSSVAAAAVVLSAAAAAACAGNGESSAQAPGISAAAPGVPRPRPAVGLTWRRARKRPMGEPVLGVGRLEEREFGREEGEKKKKRKEAPLTSFPLPPLIPPFHSSRDQSQPRCCFLFPRSAARASRRTEERRSASADG